MAVLLSKRIRKTKKFITIDVEISFEWVEMEKSMVKSPGFVFFCTEHNQSIVKPIWYIGKAI